MIFITNLINWMQKLYEKNAVSIDNIIELKSINKIIEFKIY